MEAKKNVVKHVKKINKRKHVGSSSSHGNKGVSIKKFMGTFSFVISMDSVPKIVVKIITRTRKET